MAARAVTAGRRIRRLPLSAKLPRILVPNLPPNLARKLAYRRRVPYPQKPPIGNPPAIGRLCPQRLRITVTRINLMILWRFRPSSEDSNIRELYGAIVAQARLPVFYQSYGVPDTVDGRFDLIVLH